MHAGEGLERKDDLSQDNKESFVFVDSKFTSL